MTEPVRTETAVVVRPAVGQGHGRGLRRFLRGRRWVRTGPVGLVGLLAASAAAALAVAVFTTGTGSQPAGAGNSSPAAAASGTAATASGTAAAWVAEQISPDATVSCDPDMCRQLRQDGFPAARLKPLTVTAPGPSGSAVVVATPVVRNQFGARLAADYAPQVLASFGSGADRIDIRTVAPGTAAAFAAALAVQHTALASAGQQLLGNRNIDASPEATTALRTGQVDSRLLAILSLLSSQGPVHLAAFTAAPGADPGVPMRSAQLAAPAPVTETAILSLLQAQQGPYRPAMTAVSKTASGEPGITLRYDAPAPADAVPS